MGFCHSHGRNSGSAEACCTEPRLGCLRRGPTEEADSVRAIKGRRGLSLTSLHLRRISRTSQPVVSISTGCLSKWTRGCHGDVQQAQGFRRYVAL